MSRRDVATVVIVVWAIIGATIALGSLPSVNADAKVFVGIASVAFPTCALGAVWALRSSHERLAGLLLILSVATPTYMAAALNLPALAMGVMLLVAPQRRRSERRSLSQAGSLENASRP